MSSAAYPPQLNRSWGKLRSVFAIMPSSTKQSNNLSALRRRANGVERALATLLGRPAQRGRTGDPLDVLIGTILSQNTNDRNSHRAFTNLRAAFSSWDEVRSAPVKDIADVIRSGGMAPSKSKRIKALLEELYGRHGELTLERLHTASTDEVFAELTAFDGVGNKTAACVCIFALNREVFPVDTHIHRVCNRLGLVRTSTPDQTFDAMRPLIPKGKAYAFHMNLIRFGRRVCKAQNPQCGACPLFEMCEWKDKKKYVLAKAMGDERMDFMLMDAL